MSEIKKIQLNACLIVEGIAFEIITSDGQIKLIATDLDNPNYKASFVLWEHELILSVSSFREKNREQALFNSICINKALLIDEVKNA